MVYQGCQHLLRGKLERQGLPCPSSAPLSSTMYPSMKPLLPHHHHTVPRPPPNRLSDKAFVSFCFFESILQCTVECKGSLPFNDQIMSFQCSSSVYCALVFIKICAPTAWKQRYKLCYSFIWKLYTAHFISLCKATQYIVAMVVPAVMNSFAKIFPDRKEIPDTVRVCTIVQ